MSQLRSDAADDLPQCIRAQLERGIEAFEHAFHRRPRFAAVAPGRVNLIGEHTDYNEGFVLPIAIQRQTLMLADHATDDRSTLWALDLNETARIDLTGDIEPMRGTAANYLLGVARQFADRGLRLPNLDVLATSTVPIGAGLSSSAAAEVAFATLLEQVLDAPLDPLEKALLCQRAEHTFPGTPCGIMDMFAATMARPGHAMLIDCRSNQAQFVPMPSEHVSLLIVDTEVKHELASSAYADRRATCEAVASILGVRSLRDADLAMLNHDGLSIDARKKALHVVAENTRTVLAAAALGAGQVDQFGELMFASHASLRDLYEVSCPELDLIVETAQAMSHHSATRSRRNVERIAADPANCPVLGARMTGGGFGGCAIVLCSTPALEQVQSRIAQAFTERFGRSCEMFTTAPADGARAIQVH